MFLLFYFIIFLYLYLYFYFYNSFVTKRKRKGKGVLTGFESPSLETFFNVGIELKRVRKTPPFSASWVQRVGSLKGFGNRVESPSFSGSDHRSRQSHDEAMMATCRSWPPSGLKSRGKIKEGNFEKRGDVGHKRMPKREEIFAEK